MFLNVEERWIYLEYHIACCHLHARGRIFLNVEEMQMQSGYHTAVVSCLNMGKNFENMICYQKELRNEKNCC